MHDDVDRILISQGQLATRVAELARQITADHSADPIGSGEITIVPILTGAFIFTADLIRRIPLAMKIGLMTVSSYPGASIATQGSKLLGQQLGDVRGRRVLLIDDILDSGGTLRLVVPMLRELGAATVRTAVLLRKDRPEARDTPVDYVGFDIPNEFVVGYGLDYNDVYRNLPDIVILRPDAIERKPA
jgi:hypoxanthine phosphoribosyltransferase